MRTSGASGGWLLRQLISIHKIIEKRNIMHSFTRGRFKKKKKYYKLKISTIYSFFILFNCKE